MVITDNEILWKWRIFREIPWNLATFSSICALPHKINQSINQSMFLSQEHAHNTEIERETEEIAETALK